MSSGAWIATTAMVLVVGTYAVFARTMAERVWRFADVLLRGHFYRRETFVRRHVWSARVIGGAMVVIGLAAMAAHL